MLAPYAVVAVLDGDTLTVCPAGGAEPDLLCEVGSVTKVMTATLVLQHVERGDIGIDDPVVDYVPEFVLDPPAATATVTVRHLLTHTSGVDFDEFTDSGDGDNSLALYVRDGLRGEAWDPPGQRWNYSNGGYSLLGRLVEVLDGRPWDDALTARMSDPVGITATTWPRLPPHRVVATGHSYDPPSASVFEEHRHFPRNAGPAGGALATAADLVSFAYELAAGGGRLLGPDWAQQMGRPHTNVREGGVPRRQGLGWLLGPSDVPYYAGGTPGHTAFLTVRPGPVVVGAVANGPGAGALVAAVGAHLSGSQAPRPAPGPGAGPDFAPTDCTGTYARRHVTHEVSCDGETLISLQVHHGPVAELLPDPTPERLRPLGGGRFTGGPGLLWDFSDPDSTGRPTRLLTLRSHIRVG